MAYNQCIPAGFFGYKPIGMLILKCEFLGSHMISDQSLLLSTIVLNDIYIYIYIYKHTCYIYIYIGIYGKYKLYECSF